MARPKKVFTKTETRWARDYIRRKFGLDQDWPHYDNWAANNKARKAFDDLPPGDAGAMQGWCRSFLDDKQQEQLLCALRARKKRQNVELPLKNVTLTWEAWNYLSGLANRDKVTISDFLTKRLEREYREYLEQEDAQNQAE